MKPLSAYSDYRAYMADWLKERREARLPASNRWFAMKTGVNSSSWLTALLKGRRNLTKETMDRISALMKHTPTERRIFEALVFFNQARSLEDRNRYYLELCRLQKTKDARVVKENEYDFYSAWHHTAVRSLIGMHGFRGDFAALAARVTPPITPAQAKQSVTLLEKLGFIRKEEDGVHRLAEQRIRSGDQIRSMAVANFQQSVMRLAQEALDRYPLADRDITTVSVGVSEATFRKIREVLAEARRQVMDLADQDREADRVYQLNMQLFPLSTGGKGPGVSP